jgi:hypothetical protein
MGHASIQVTFDTYGHLRKSTGDDAKTMAQIEARRLALMQQECNSRRLNH